MYGMIGYIDIKVVLFVTYSFFSFILLAISFSRLIPCFYDGFVVYNFAQVNIVLQILSTVFWRFRPVFKIFLV